MGWVSGRQRIQGRLVPATRLFRPETSACCSGGSRRERGGLGPFPRRRLGLRSGTVWTVVRLSERRVLSERGPMGHRRDSRERLGLLCARRSLASKWQLADPPIVEVDRELRF